MSGHPKYNIHANDIDFQIESIHRSDRLRAFLARLTNTRTGVDVVMNCGVTGVMEEFIRGCYALPFSRVIARRVVEARPTIDPC